MNITTVGDLIEALEKFDRSLPVVKNIPDLSELQPQYTPLEMIEKMIYCIRPETFADGFCDASDTDPHSFNAVVL